MAEGAPTTSLLIFLSLKDLEPRKTSWTGPKGPAPPTWIRATLGPPSNADVICGLVGAVHRACC